MKCSLGAGPDLLARPAGISLCSSEIPKITISELLQHRMPVGINHHRDEIRTPHRARIKKSKLASHSLQHEFAVKLMRYHPCAM